MTYEADGFIEAAREFILNVCNPDTEWTLSVKRLEDGEKQSIDVEDIRKHRYE